jgi:hypothetical protein
MKILNFSLFSLFFLTALNIKLIITLQVKSQSKQDAITSLVIFAKGQAEIQRENQVSVLKGQNKSAFGKEEFSNLLKTTESVNLDKMAGSLKNETIHNSTRPNKSSTQTVKKQERVARKQAISPTPIKNSSDSKSQNKTIVQTNRIQESKQNSKVIIIKSRKDTGNNTTSHTNSTNGSSTVHNK